MRTPILTTTAILTSISLATPISQPRDLLYTNIANDMTATIADPSSSPCRPLALIFARGTFDSGNLGVWVGPELVSSLTSLVPSSSLAAQGVDSTAYPATLSSYLSEGGSNAGAAALATTVSDYAATCPDAAIVVAGWSQGASVVHKGLAQLDSLALARVAGVVTFGDPWHLFSNESLPAGINEATVKGYCFDGVALDPLCAPLPAGFEVPQTLEGVTGAFSGLPSVAHGAQQVEAAASLVVRFPGQLLKSWGSFVGALKGGQFVRLLLTPQHFEYGNSGIAAEAAEFIAGLPMVKAAVGA